MNKRIAGIAGLVIVAVAVTFFIFKSQNNEPVEPDFFDEPEEAIIEEPVEPQFKFGIPLELFDLEEGKIILFQ